MCVQTTRYAAEKIDRTYKMVRQHRKLPTDVQETVGVLRVCV